MGVFPEKDLTVDNQIRRLVPDSRTFFNRVFHSQGDYIEVTTFVGRGEDKRRLDFAFPIDLYNDMSAEEIVTQALRAYQLTRRK